MQILTSTFRSGQTQAPIAQPPNQFRTLPFRPPPQPLSYGYGGSFQLAQFNNPASIPYVFPSPYFPPQQQGALPPPPSPPQNIPAQRRRHRRCRCCNRCIRCTNRILDRHPEEFQQFPNELNETNFQELRILELENLVATQAVVMEDQEDHLRFVEYQNGILRSYMNDNKNVISEVEKVLAKEFEKSMNLEEALEKEKASCVALKEEVSALKAKVHQRTVEFLSVIHLDREYENMTRDDVVVGGSSDLELGQEEATCVVAPKKEIVEKAVVQRSGPHSIIIKRNVEQEKCSEVHLNNRNEQEVDVEPKNGVKMEVVMEQAEAEANGGVSSPSKDEEETFLDDGCSWGRLFCKRCFEPFPNLNRLKKHSRKCWAKAQEGNNNGGGAADTHVMDSDADTDGEFQLDV